MGQFVFLLWYFYGFTVSSCISTSMAPGQSVNVQGPGLKARCQSSLVRVNGLGAKGKDSRLRGQGVRRPGLGEGSGVSGDG